MTYSDDVMAQFRSGKPGSRFGTLFDILVAKGLKPLGKSNSDTLLFQYVDPDNRVHDVLAFRRIPSPVLSFPESYWKDRKGARARFSEPYSIAELQSPIKGVGSHSNRSVGMISLTDDTLSRLQITCEEICRFVQAEHA